MKVWLVQWLSQGRWVTEYQSEGDGELFVFDKKKCADVFLQLSKENVPECEWRVVRAELKVKK